MPIQAGHDRCELKSLLCILAKCVIQLPTDVIVTISPQYTHKDVQKKGAVCAVLLNMVSTSTPSPVQSLSITSVAFLWSSKGGNLVQRSSIGSPPFSVYLATVFANSGLEICIIITRNTSTLFLKFMDAPGGIYFLGFSLCRMDRGCLLTSFGSAVLYFETGLAKIMDVFSIWRGVPEHS